MDSRQRVVVGCGKADAVPGSVLKLLTKSPMLKDISGSSVHIFCLNSRLNGRDGRLARLHDCGVHIFLLRVCLSSGVGPSNVGPETIGTGIAMDHNHVALLDCPMPRTGIGRICFGGVGARHTEKIAIASLDIRRRLSPFKSSLEARSYLRLAHARGYISSSGIKGGAGKFRCGADPIQFPSRLPGFEFLEDCVGRHYFCSWKLTTKELLQSAKIEAHDGIGGRLQKLPALHANARIGLNATF